MTKPGKASAPAGDRKCGISTCGRVLSIYNKGDVCQSHPLAKKDRFRERTIPEPTLGDHIAEIPGENTAEELSADAGPLPTEEYPGALRLFQITANLMKVPTLCLVRRRVSPRSRASLARDMMVYLMVTDLKMSAGDVRTFLRYKDTDFVGRALEKICEALKTDEKIINSIGLIRSKYNQDESP